MIRIVKPGKIPEPPKPIVWEWKGVCAKCSCEMVADEWPADLPPNRDCYKVDGCGTPDGQERFISECLTCDQLTVFIRRIKREHPIPRDKEILLAKLRGVLQGLPAGAERQSDEWLECAYRLATAGMIVLHGDAIKLQKISSVVTELAHRYELFVVLATGKSYR